MTKQRIRHLDIAKGLAVFFMIMQHCIILYEHTGGENSDLLGTFFLLAGTAPAAPVFMFIMGIFLMQSHATLQQNIFRGIKLIALGYALNILRFALPIGLTELMGIESLPGSSAIELFFAADILQLAGISIIVAALLRPYITTMRSILIALSIAILSPLLWSETSPMNPLAVLWGTGENIFFPIFPWIIYAILGMGFSAYFMHIKSLPKTFLYGIIITIIGAAVYDIFPVGDYHRSGLAVHLMLTGFIFYWIALCKWTDSWLMDHNLFVRTVTFWSKNVTEIYVVQWIIFGWSMLIISTNQHSSYTAVALGAIVLLITHFIVQKQYIKNTVRQFTR